MQATLDSAPDLHRFDANARFQVRGGDRTIWLAEDALWVTVLEPHPSPRPPDGGHPTPLSAAERGEGPGERGEVRGVHLKLSFPGANPHPRLEPFGRLETSVNHFLGNDQAEWRTNVPVWGGVRYVDLYPGVDLVVGAGLAPVHGRVQGSPLLWHLEVRDGADLSAVRLKVEGAEAVSLLPSPAGSLSAGGR